jgi:hypothetical protein
MISKYTKIHQPRQAIMSDAQTRLNDFLAEQARWLAAELPPGRSIYHYTSAAGMQAIVSSGVMRAYNLGQMNDLAEGRYAASVMRAHIDRGYAVEADANASELLGAMRRQLTSINLSNVFAISLTSDGDEPGMWRLYADRGRGFSFAIPLDKALLWAGHGHNGMLLKCTYDHNVLTEFCVRTLGKIREIYVADIVGGLKPHASDYASMFFDNIAWFAPAFKPSVWQDEKEWRFIFARPPDVHRTLSDGRTYIELPLTVTAENPYPITAICGGPDCDYEDDILPLQRILYEKGHGAYFPIHVSTTHVTRAGRRAPVRRVPTEPGSVPPSG